MTPLEQMRKDDAAIAAFGEVAIKRGLMRTCLNCEHFKEDTEVCGQFKERPPARIIVLGCEQYEQEIPF